MTLRFEKVFTCALLLTQLSGCAQVMQDVLGQGNVRKPNNVVASDIRWLSLEDPDCVLSGESVTLDSITAYIWNGSQTQALTMPLKSKSPGDGRFSTDNVEGAILDSEAAESCSVSATKEIDCKSVTTGKESGSGYIKICRANGLYSRDSIEAMVLTSHYLIEESFKFYNSITGRKDGLLPAQTLAQLKFKQDYKLPSGATKTLYVSDNAAFQPSINGDSPVFFHLYPTSTAAFKAFGNNLWEVPFVMRHEFAHHVFNHYTGGVTASQGLAPGLDYVASHHSILPHGHGRPKGMSLSDSDIVTQAIGGVNEAYADLYAYFQGGSASDQLKGVNCLQVSRDPASSVTKGGAAKGLTAAQISVFEGKSTANEYINCYEPTFDDVHDIALALGYPLAQFIKQSNAGADSAGQGKVMLLWAERIKQLVTTDLSSVTVDTLVRELVLTLKTDMSKNIAAACPDLKAAITGLPLASAACQ